MPLNVDPRDRGLTIRTAADRMAQGPKPVTLEQQLFAAYGVDHTAVSLVHRLREPETPERGDFDPLAHLQPGEELRARDFVDADSPEEMQVIRDRHQREREARRRLGEGPLPAILASGLAIATDPTTYIPVIGAAGKAGAVARFARVGAATAGVNLGQELLLHATQNERTAEETALATLLGGLFGGSAAMIAGGLRGVGEGAAHTKAVLGAVEDAQAILDGTFPESTIGAARSPRGSREPEMTELAPSFGVAEALGTVARRTGLLGRLVAPSVEMMTSKIPKVREFALDLVDTGLVTKGNLLHGVSHEVPVQTAIKAHEAKIYSTAGALKTIHRQLRGRGVDMKRTEFYHEVGRSMRRKDKHVLPEVEEAAQLVRKNVYEPFREDAIRLGILNEDVPPGDVVGYLTRVYKRPFIRAHRDDFKEVIERWLLDNLPLDELKLDPAEVGNIANGIIDKILGTAQGRIPIDLEIPGPRGPLKGRTLNIPDLYGHRSRGGFLFEDFLEDNVMDIVARYVKTVGADVEFTRVFGKDGKTLPASLKEHFDELDLEYKILLGKAKSEKERIRLQKQRERDIDLAQSLMDAVRGIHDVPADPGMLGARTLKGIRTFNFVRLLGSSLLSQIPDAALLPMKQGFGRAFGVLLGDTFNGFKAIRMGKDQAQLFGTAWDIAGSQRISAIADIGERYMDETRFERVLDFAGRQFGNIAFLNPWNVMMKSATSVVASTRILEVSRKLAAGGKVSRRDRARLAASGIDEQMARRFAAQEKHWQTTGRAILGNTEAWTDLEARNAFGHALLKDVDDTIITPGAGDAGIWTGTEWGKTIFQFKRFSSAATQRVLLSSLQYRDAAAFNGIVLAVAMGAMGQALRDIAATGEVRERTGAQWAADAVDRSGVIAMFFELNALNEKLLGTGPVSALTGRDVSRFASRDFLGQLLGPSAGAISETAAAARSLVKGVSDGATQSDLHKIRKLAPLQNHVFLRRGFDAVEEVIADEFNVPKRRPRKKR